MDATKQPGIKFDAIVLKEINFSRNPGILPKPELSIRFESAISLSADKKKMNYELTCHIDEAGKSFVLKCSMIGMFSIVEETENMNLEEFSKGNAPALIFPYVREVIASTTLRAGIPSVLLPPLNIQAMMSQALIEK